MTKSHPSIALKVTLIAFLVLILLKPIDQALLLSFGTFYYFLWNGYFLYKLNFPQEKLSIIQAFTYSLLLSISLNSLSIYLLNRTFEMPFTLKTTFLTASTLLAIIIIAHYYRYKKVII